VEGAAQFPAICGDPAYTCLNETALSCGWAFADDAAEHPMKEKYTILHEMAKRERVAVWAQSTDAEEH
jgi:hypothetical protein